MGLIKEFLNMAKATKKAAKKATKKVTKKKVTKKAATKKVSKKATKKVAKKTTAKKVAKKTSKKVTKKVTKKVAKKVAKKTTKKVAKKATKKVVKKVEKKVTPKKQVSKTSKVESKKKVVKQIAESPVEEVVVAQEVVVDTPEITEILEEVVVPEKIEEPVSAKQMEINEAASKVNDEIAGMRENFSWADIANAISSLDFFVDHRSDDCSEKGCDNLRTTQQYCRLHYISNWYEINKKREILKEGKLQEYIEDLVSKYPPKLIDSLLSDLHDDKDFFKVLHELNIHSEIDMVDEEFGAVDEDDDDADKDIAVETRTFGASQRFEDEQ